jgi:hypothetical protein
VKSELFARPFERIANHGESWRERNSNHVEPPAYSPPELLERPEKPPVIQEPPQPLFACHTIAEATTAYVLENFDPAHAGLRKQKFGHIDSVLKAAEWREHLQSLAAPVSPIADRVLRLFYVVFHALLLPHRAASFQ